MARGANTYRARRRNALRVQGRINDWRDRLYEGTNKHKKRDKNGEAFVTYTMVKADDR